MTARSDVLALLHGKAVDGYPCFSGLINVTAAGLDDLGFVLSEVHADAAKMAATAATSYRLFGFGSAIVPLDICVEAEVLGARVDFGKPSEYRFPRVYDPLAESAAAMLFEVPEDLIETERVSTVIDAIGILKDDVGADVAIGAWVPGPFTLAALLVDLPTLLGEIHTDPSAVGAVLDRLTPVLAATAIAYRKAGADFLTVHEMGGSPGFIGPGPFETLVLPRLRRLLDVLPAPRVLSVCGRTDHAASLFGGIGADALSVDQLSDLAVLRADVGAGALIFGNIDPVATLGSGTEADVRAAVAHSISATADAVWPGCDLLPDFPEANLRAMIDEAARHGTKS